MNNKILAIDPSLRSTGYCYYGPENNKIVTGTINTQTKNTTRLIYIRDSVLLLIDKVNPDLVVYEDYSMGSKGKTFHIGELGGVLKVLFYEYRIPLLSVPPSCLKMFATSKGNADKQSIVNYVKNEWSMPNINDDQADAFILYLMGLSIADGRTHRNRHKVSALAGCTIYRY